MIFLSAQPDDYYFLWQLEVQVINFNKVGIAPEQIHILLAYDPKAGLRHYFREFIEKYQHMAGFYSYPDQRVDKRYSSSIRPNIIKQHFGEHSWLEQEHIFYHDSDIIFRELPDLSRISQGDNWYVSDASSYLSSEYITKVAGVQTLERMCNIVGIDPLIVQENDHHAGGAQYFLKNVDAQFWNKVELDATKLYVLLRFYNNRVADNAYEKYGTPRSLAGGIQGWCADMWSLLWNGWHAGRKVMVAPELEFCWPNDRVEKWFDTTILHYAGVLPTHRPASFWKGEFLNFSPIYNDFSGIDEQTCNKPLVDFFRECRRIKDASRIDLRDMTILIPFYYDSESRWENLRIITMYLDRYFLTNIIIVEAGREPKVNKSVLPDCCRYQFVPEESGVLHRTRLNNLMVQMAETDFISLYDTDMVIPIPQMLMSVEILRSGRCSMVSPYDGECMSVEKLSKLSFIHMMDPDFFLMNKGKYATIGKRVWGGVININRQHFIDAGMDNEYFKSWGPDDVERVKRMKNLGYNVRRVKGPAFHLPHERKENSGYNDTYTVLTYMEEYVKVCNMRQRELQLYVDTWSWKTGNKLLTT